MGISVLPAFGWIMLSIYEKVRIPKYQSCSEMKGSPAITRIISA
jgi:hypothetical protein